MEISNREITGKKIIKALAAAAVASMGVAMLLSGGDDGSQTLLPIPPSSTPIDLTAGLGHKLPPATSTPGPAMSGVVCEIITGNVNYASNVVSNLAIKGGTVPGKLSHSVYVIVFDLNGSYVEKAKDALRTSTNKISKIRKGDVACIYDSRNLETDGRPPTFKQAWQLAGGK